MKKLLTLLALCTATTFAVAQTTMNIYQSNGTTISLPISTIDSITFTSPPPLMVIWQTGGGSIGIVLAGIDSVTYTLPNTGTLPTLSTFPVGNIASTSATSGGNITNNGGTAVTQRGVVWGTSPNPTTANSQSSDGSGTGNYTSNLTGLAPNTTYYVRAYATNSAGTAYGNQLSFTTTGGAGSITALNCNSATNNGTLTAGTAASGVSSSVPYTGGNGGTHNGQTVNSTGVTGLTATLSAGSFASGSGSLTYTISGTPNANGTANFSLNTGGQNCTLSRTVNAPVGSITAINCNSTTNSGTLTSGTAASGVSSSVPYTGGNGGTHNGQTVTSTGVTGLTATLSAGAFASGSGSLTYTITGTPNASGTANFSLNIGGQNCTLSRTVNAPVGSITGLNCDGIGWGLGNDQQNVVVHGFLVDAWSYLGYSGGNGGAFDWQSISSTGVTGLTLNVEGGTFAIGNGSIYVYVNGVPDTSGTASFALNLGGQSCTIELYVAPQAIVATLDCDNATNSGSLTAGTAASGVSSSVPYTGGNGGYYSVGNIDNGVICVNSTGVTGLTACVLWDEIYVIEAGTLVVGNSIASGSGSLTYTITGTPSAAGTANFSLNIGGQNCTLSRTVNAPVGSITSLDCESVYWCLDGQDVVVAGFPVGGGDCSGFGYSGGGGGSYDAQSISSTGVTGLTLDFDGGTFAIGNGYIYFNQYGIPDTSGTASFALNLGGQTCTFELQVAPQAVVSTLDCDNATSGILMAGTQANEVISSVPYTGGNGGYYPVDNGGGDTNCVSSTGVTGLTACILWDGAYNGGFQQVNRIASGSGSLTYAITGTPSAAGTANFSLNIGGQNCTLSCEVGW